MRHAFLVLVFAAHLSAADSQLTILPKAGVENSITKISYNDLPYFSPVNQSQPHLSVRADYKFKNGFGPFAGLSTNRSLLNYNFNDPENGMTTYRASLGKMQLRLEAGVQYSTKAILFNQKRSTNVSKTESSERMAGCSRDYSASCSHYSPGCSEKKSGMAKKANSQMQAWSVRIQPSAGFGFIPSGKADLISETSGNQTSYTYNAGNIKTAAMAGIGFEFAKNRTKLFTLSVNYFKSMGDNKTTFTSESSTKTTTTLLNSKFSGWNASIGIPVSFSKTPTYKTRKAQQCKEYRMRCTSKRII